ncbi:ABC transporter ATP-binding protein [Vagococcus silagei]|uniref:ABC transporter ATP-binding protein n=1 Tax=Vagococcus silagei TaxID=2508885 RepID=A0A4S3B3D9_9ENTE|nr:ABC transporter ATP-binding protein [Vagococcus silagei]THB60073.1 ABC transporter ATP-binding protein [Vagococcus silagei]
MTKMIKRISLVAFILAMLFMGIQVMADLYLPTLTSDIINNGVAKGDIDYIWKIGKQMLLISLIGISGSLINTFIATRQGQKVGRKLRSDIYKKVEYSSNSEFDTVGTASLITRTTNDVNQIQMFVQLCLRMILNAPIMLIGASYLAYHKDPGLTRIFFVVVPVLLVVIGVAMYFAIPLFKSLQKKTDNLNLIFRESLNGVRVIRAFNRTKFEENRFDGANLDYTNTAIKVNTILAVMTPVITLIISLTNVAIIWFGGHSVADGVIQVGDMMAFTTYAMQILMSFMLLTMILVFVPRAQVSANRINEILNLKNEIEDPKEAQKFDSTNSLAFQNVSMRYRGAEKLAIEGIDFEAGAGETVAIIGGTGSGKSTMINLIPRFYDVESGMVSVNTVDVRMIDQNELRDSIGYIPQKAVLFSGTIRSNMLYGNPNATDEEIWHALEIAQAKKFVADLPEGLESTVEQGGGNFSGGQRQRLCIARALIKPASIYVFDDSFSALDFKTDALLRKALKENITDAVIVIVAQRISTVVEADTIIVLDEGQMVGRGTHQELKTTNTTYQEIIESQMREEEI